MRREQNLLAVVRPANQANATPKAYVVQGVMKSH